MNATDFYRKLNTENKIKDFGGYGDFTPDQMIWFAEEYAKQLAIPIEPPVILPKPNPFCENCNHLEWQQVNFSTDDENAFCKRHGIKLDTMFPDMDLDLDEIGCVQFEQREA